MRKISAFVCLLTVLSAVHTRYQNYPLFKQADPVWTNEKIGDLTLGYCGCLITSISMILNQRGMTYKGEAYNPKVCLQFLKDNGGLSGNLVAFAAYPKWGITMEQKFNVTDIKKAFDAGHDVIIFIDGWHWVVVKGYNTSGFQVNDGGYQKQSDIAFTRVNSAIVLRRF